MSSLRTAVLAAAAVLASLPASAAWRVAAWIPPWDPNALTTLQSHTGALAEANPVWYSWNADGSIAKNWNAENPTWRAAMTGSALLPTEQNVVAGSFDGTAAATMLASSSAAAAHADAVTALVTQNVFDGIDVDFERVPSASRAQFTAYVTALASKLHAAGKKLSVTVYPKTSDAQNWNGPGAQDWVAIGKVADSVKIMAYDYHWDTSSAGDLTPLSWLDQVAAYAVSAIPASKIVMGLPWYGYDWSGSTGSRVSYASAMALAETSGATITHDANGEATFTHGSGTCYFQDRAAYQAKLNVLAKYPGITSIANWAAGSEDPAIWDLIAPANASTSTHGDANGDGSVGAPDIFYLVNYLFSGGPAPKSPSDVNGDGAVTTADVLYLVNYVFSGGPAPK